MSRKKTYFIEETQTYHTYDFLKERQGDPKWAPAYGRIKRERLIFGIVTIFVLGVVLFVGVTIYAVNRYSDSSKLPETIMDGKPEVSAPVDSLQLTEKQVVEWATAVTDERNQDAIVYEASHYTHLVTLKEDGLVYIDVVYREKQQEHVIDQFRINEHGQLEESGLYLVGIAEDEWRVISADFLDVSQVNDFQYAVKKQAPTLSKSDTSSHLDEYYRLDMGTKVLLMMSLASAKDKDTVKVFETFTSGRAGFSRHWYHYDTITPDLLAVLQGDSDNENLWYELYFDTTGDSVNPLYYVEIEEKSTGPVRSDKRELEANQTNKAVLYQHYLENEELYNRLSKQVSHDGTFLN